MEFLQNIFLKFITDMRAKTLLCCKICIFVILTREAISLWFNFYGDSTNLQQHVNKSSNNATEKLYPNPLEREYWQSLQLPQTTKRKSSLSIRYKENCQGQSCIKGSYQNCNPEHTKSLNNFLTYIRKNKPGIPAENTKVVKNHKSHCGQNAYCQKDDENFSCCDFSFKKPICVDAFRCNDTVENYKSNWKLKGMDLNHFKQSDACDWVLDSPKTESLSSTTESDTSVDAEPEIFEIASNQEILNWLQKSNYKKFYVIGDSHARGMYITLIAMLSNEFKYQFGHQLSDQCFGYYEWFWHRPCHDLVKPKMSFTSTSINEESVSNHTNEFISDINYVGVHNPVNFRKSMEKLYKDFVIWNTETLIVFEQGTHQKMDFDSIKKMLDDLVENTKLGTSNQIQPNSNETSTNRTKSRKTATIIYLPPPLHSYYKPQKYWSYQGNPVREKLASQMKDYIEQTYPDVEFFDLAMVTYGLDSFDGTHHFYQPYRVFWSYVVRYL